MKTNEEELEKKAWYISKAEKRFCIGVVTIFAVILFSMNILILGELF